MYFTQWLVVFGVAVFLKYQLTNKAEAEAVAEEKIPETSSVPASEISDYDASHFVRDTRGGTQVGAFAI
jgi:hypothetical protein